MANPLFNALGNSGAGDMAGLLQQFQQFKNAFHGDPQQQVQQLLNSGKITQQQYDRAVQQARALQGMLKM